MISRKKKKRGTRETRHSLYLRGHEGEGILKKKKKKKSRIFRSVQTKKKKGGGGKGGNGRQGGHKT